MKKTAIVTLSLLLLLTQAFSSLAAEVSTDALVSGSSLVMSTEYPSQAATAGDTLDFYLDFENEEKSQLVNLTVDAAPEGWGVDFLGDGASIGSVYVKKGQTDKGATLRVTVPEDTATGLYEVRVKAAGTTGESVLSLKLGIEEQAIGESGLVIEYGSQEGTASTTFSFSTTIQNNTSEEQSYSLSATSPTGWTTAFTADGTQVAAVTVPARTSQNLIVKITPAAQAEAGEYTVPFSATSARDSLQGDLSVTITGDYALSVSTPSGRLSFDATANKKSSVTLSVTNSGNIALQNINLSSSAPTGWTVEYSESTIETLEAGATKEITVYVTPAEDALSGDYATIISASNSVASSSASFRVTVKTETTWGIVGALIILAVVAGLAFCFKKFGRK